MKFNPITITEKDLLTPFLFKYGASSCQHSFAAMLGLASKYGDEYCIEDDVLYIHRSGRDHDKYRVYLAPLAAGDKDMVSCVGKIIKDAHENGKLASFETVTGEFVSSLNASCSNDVQIVGKTSFMVTQDRDYAEYIYSTDSLSVLPGRALAPKRNRIRAFYSAYEDHIRIENISAKNMDEVRAFQEKWITEKKKSDDDPMLETENEAIGFYLDNYDVLGFTGIVVYVYGTVVGYAAGVPLSDSTMDEIIEKGLPEITGIYQLLCNEFALICCKNYKYINREEDIGLEGLRRAKMSYQPEILLSKYIMREL